MPDTDRRNCSLVDEQTGTAALALLRPASARPQGGPPPPAPPPAARWEGGTAGGSLYRNLPRFSLVFRRGEACLVRLSRAPARRRIPPDSQARPYGFAAGGSAGFSIDPVTALSPGFRRPGHWAPDVADSATIRRSPPPTAQRGEGPGEGGRRGRRSPSQPRETDGCRPSTDRRADPTRTVPGHWALGTVSSDRSSRPSASAGRRTRPSPRSPSAPASPGSRPPAPAPSRRPFPGSPA